MTDIAGTLSMLVEDLLDAVFMFLTGLFQLVAEVFMSIGIGGG